LHLNEPYDVVLASNTNERILRQDGDLIAAVSRIDELECIVIYTFNEGVVESVSCGVKITGLDMDGALQVWNRLCDEFEEIGDITLSHVVINGVVLTRASRPSGATSHNVIKSYGRVGETWGFSVELNSGLDDVAFDKARFETIEILVSRRIDPIFHYAP
jgi:hypothetical protein